MIGSVFCYVDFREHNPEAIEYANDAVKLMFDASYWADLSIMMENTKDFKQALLFFQNDGKRANLADVYERYSILCKKYADQPRKLRFIEKTWNDLSSNLHASCMMLDWRKHGSEHLTEDDRKDGLEGIKQYLKQRANDANGKLFEKFQEKLLIYDSKTDIFENIEFSNLNENSRLQDMLRVYRAMTYRYRNDSWGIFFNVAEDICRKRVFFVSFYLFVFVLLQLESFFFVHTYTYTIHTCNRSK